MALKNNFRGEAARLIPTLPDSKREEKATSVLLAAFRVIPNFAKEVLREAGAKIGSRATVECFTEVVFNGAVGKGLRPDGLIIVHTSRSDWTALVESKVGTATLGSEQLESYLKLAKELGIDAVITISNEFAVLPTHHPTSVSKSATKKVELYHFSWLSIITKAVLATDSSVVDDPEQAFILAELIRYLKSPNSGVSALTKMGPAWKQVCDLIQQQAPLTNHQPIIESVVGSWHQLMRYLSLELSMSTSSAVSLSMARSLKNDPEAKLRHNMDELTNQRQLSASFDIPNAASSIEVTAHFGLRTVCFSMCLQTPQDVKRPTAAINWLTRQLKNVERKDEIAIRVHWPKRIPMTMNSLAEAIENPDQLVPDSCRHIPKEIEVWVVIDLAGRFRGSKTFIEETASGLNQFYTQVGQQLAKWQPKAPKMKSEPKSSDKDELKGGLYGKSLEVDDAHDEQEQSKPDLKLMLPGEYFERAEFPQPSQTD